MLQGVILSLVVLVNIFLALFIFLRDPKNRINSSLLYITALSTFWVVSNFMADRDTLYSLEWTRLTFIGPIFVPYLVLLFTSHIVLQPLSKVANLVLLGTSLFITVITIFTNHVIAEVTPRYAESMFNGTDVSKRGVLYIPLVAWLLTVFILALGRQIHFFQTSSGKQQSQIRSVIFGFVSLGIIALTTNALLPVILDTTQPAKFAPLANLSLVVFLSYSILRYQFLDIRNIVARAVGYLLFVFVVIAVFTSLVFILAGSVVDFSNITTAQRVFFVAITILFVFIFQYSKKHIDRLTAKFFFRNSYSIQEEVNNLSGVLAKEIDLVSIVRKTSVILVNSIRPTYLRFIVYDEQGKLFYDYGTDSAPSVRIDYDSLNNVADQILIERDGSKSQKRFLNKIQARALVPLRSGSAIVGAIILGPKQTGSLYTQQDIKLLQIVENEISVSVQNSRYYEEIQKFNATLQRKIKLATTRLEHSNEKLKQLDEAKDEFISMASHQLRTPLTSIKGYVSMVLEGDAGKVSKQQKKLLEEAFASSQRMVYLIADLLNVSRLRTGKFVIEKEMANLADMVEEEISQLKPTARSRNLKLSYKKPKRFPEIMLDETKTRQVIMNFVDNAIYYTPSGGNIDVSIKSTAREVEFTVTDDGIGVPKDKQAKLFGKFYRADNAQKARPDGTGLGLFMAKKVVLAQGGSIIFKSEEGKGSTFGFRLKK